MDNYYFVMLENDEVVGVAPARREEMALDWAKAKTGRHVKKVPECT